MNKIEEPKAQARFETTAEVIGGLDTAFKHTKRKARRLGSEYAVISEDGAHGSARPTISDLRALFFARVIRENA